MEKGCVPRDHIAAVFVCVCMLIQRKFRKACQASGLN